MHFCGFRYTKRALLAGVYTTSELYLLTDYSPGYADTWQQMDRRLQDIVQLGKAAQGVGGPGFTT
jgi:ubiquinone biosynthesis protein COQ9